MFCDILPVPMFLIYARFLNPRGINEIKETLDLIQCQTSYGDSYFLIQISPKS